MPQRNSWSDTVRIPSLYLHHLPVILGMSLLCKIYKLKQTRSTEIGPDRHSLFQIVQRSNSICFQEPYGLRQLLSMHLTLSQENEEGHSISE